jgi:hypothetical protein
MRNAIAGTGRRRQSIPELATRAHREIQPGLPRNDRPDDSELFRLTQKAYRYFYGTEPLPKYFPP